MSTYAQLKTLIAAKLARSDLSAEIADEINNAIQYYQPERFIFNQTTGTFSTVASQKAYGSSDSVPSYIQRIDMIQIAISSTDLRFPQETTYPEILEMDPSLTNGQPEYWAYYQSKIYFYPIPDAVYTVTVSYHKGYADLSADGDTNDFTSGIPKSMIVARTLRKMYEDYIMDADQAAAQTRNEQDYFMRLKDAAQQLTMSRKLIVPDCI